MVSSGRSRLDQLKAATQGLEEKYADDFNQSQKSELDKLKASLATLDQLKNGDWNKGHEDQLDDIQAKLDKLKASLSGLDNLYSDDFNQNTISSYQEFFDYNHKDVNISDAKYIEMLNKAIEQSKTTGKVKISFESSASRVPTKTHGSNVKLATKRANDAKDKIIASLVNKGISKENIIVLNINSKVRGPKYKGDYKNKNAYEKFQYVIIRVH